MLTVAPGRYVKGIVGAIRRRPTLELVERARIDDRRAQVCLEVLGEVRPGDVLVATVDPALDLKGVQAVWRELERWVRRNAPGAEVLVVSDELTLGVFRASMRRLRAIDEALQAVEETVDAYHAGAEERPGTADVRKYAAALELGVAHLRYVLDLGLDDVGGQELAAA